MTFTVVIPVKNGAASLDRCLTSIRESVEEAGLNDGRVDIVVVDNGSADRTAEIAEDRGCRVIYVPAAKGVSASRNAEGVVHISLCNLDPNRPVALKILHQTLSLDASLDINEAIIDIPLPPPPVADAVEEPEQEIFVIVEQMPTLIGGIQALMNEVEYPALARQAGVEGRVIIQLVVDENGNPKSPIVLRGVGGGCDEEAVRAVMTMKFTPGMQRGRPVPVQYSMSVLFQLKERK